MIKFGTGGFRAIIGEDFTKENIQKIGFAISDIIDEKSLNNNVIIGYDRRFLSKEAAMWLSEAFAYRFIDVFFIDKSSPTPLIMYAVKQMNIDFGFMITASHNPAIYNGIKVFTHGGKDASVVWTNLIQDKANNAKVNVMSELNFQNYVESSRIRYINPMNDYLDSILALIDSKTIRAAGLKVALDPMFGVGETGLQTILLTTRCQVGVINNRHDTLFGGKLPAPTPVTIEPLKHFVLDGGYDIGIATDGDADRIGIIDDKGNYLSPDDILVILAYYLLEYKKLKGSIVRNVSTTHRLDNVAKMYGLSCYEVPVGFKNISEKMLETNALIGGESSGGLSIRGHINGKDGIYAGALLVELLSIVKMSLSEFNELCKLKFGTVSTLELEFKLSHNEEERINIMIHELENIQMLKPFTSIDKMDGVKLAFSDGWILLRFSGTEPLLRLVGESRDEASLNHAVSTVRNYFGL